MFRVFWQRLVVKNNIPDEGIVTISIAEFKKQLEKAYLVGKKDSEATHNAAKNFEDVSQDNIGNIFKDIFGKIAE